MRVNSKIKRILIILGIFIVLCILIGTFLIMGKTWIFYDNPYASPIEPIPNEKVFSENDTPCDSELINPNGLTIPTRFYPPNGYTRNQSPNDFVLYLYSMELKPYGSKIDTYNGNQCGTSYGVFNFDIGNKNIQQCADSIIRIYSEYYYGNNQYDKISFHLTNGELLNYSDWVDGKRLFALGDFSTMLKVSSYNDSYSNFRQYLECVMNYAGTKSLVYDTSQIPLEDFTIGDMVLKSGSPGHVIMAVDEAINTDGSKCWIFAEGDIPAQNFHVITNPLHTSDMWYYQEEISSSDTILTPMNNFPSENLYRFNR